MSPKTLQKIFKKYREDVEVINIVIIGIQVKITFIYDDEVKTDRYIEYENGKFRSEL